MNERTKKILTIFISMTILSISILIATEWKGCHVFPESSGSGLIKIN